MYSLRKDILEYVIRLRVTAEGVFYTDEKIDHDFWMCRRKKVTGVQIKIRT